MEKGQIVATADIKISKGDIFELLVEDKTQEMTDLLEKKKDKLQEIKDKLKKVEDEIHEIILVDSRAPSKAKIIDYALAKSEFKERVVLWNLDILKEKRDPTKVTKSNCNYGYYAEKYHYSLGDKVTLGLEVTKDGFSGELIKRVPIKKSPLKSKVAYYNSLCTKEYKLKIEINDLGREIICLPYNRKAKNEFIRKVVKSSDIKKLLK